MKKKGFTLVELLIVMAILLMMATMMVGTLNSVGIFNKARDARRKKILAESRSLLRIITTTKVVIRHQQ